MIGDDDALFQELANDEAIAKALADHEASCTAKPIDCPACRFFESVHFIRHMIEMVDPAKILDLAGSYAAEFISDSQSIIQFLSATTQYFVEEMVDWDALGADDEDEEDEEDDEDEI